MIKMTSENVEHIGDGISLSVLFGYFFAGLPTIALVLTIIWTGIRIYETETVQRWLGKKNGTRVD